MPRPTELLHDLLVIDQSLRGQGADLIADGDLRDVIRLTQVFGFHLAVMDVREHASRHAAALAEIFRHTGTTDAYLDFDEHQRSALLAREIENPRPLIPVSLERFSEETQNVVGTFRIIAEAINGRHQGAIETYVISGAEAPSDVLAVLLLMKESGLAEPGGSGARLSIAPLFEQEQGLRDAPETIATLLRHPGVSRGAAGTRGYPGGHDRLLRLEQGDRVPRIGMGAVSGAAGPDQVIQSGRDPSYVLSWPRRRDRPRRRSNERRHPGTSTGIGGRPRQVDGAGRGHRLAVCDSSRGIPRAGAGQRGHISQRSQCACRSGSRTALRVRRSHGRDVRGRRLGISRSRLRRSAS